MSSAKAAGKNDPAGGAPARAPVGRDASPQPVKVGSHIGSTPLPPETVPLAPSERPGGRTHAYASTPATGAATGRAPRPAPTWLHQLNAYSRRSMRDWSTNVLMS